MRTVALIGDPVSHSVSPPMHKAAFRQCGLDLDYLAIRVRPDELTRLFPTLRAEHLGLNVTRPLKESVLPLVDEVTDEAAEVRAVNTVSFDADRSTGDITDGHGFLTALARRGAPAPANAVVLGTGGVARAIGFALHRAGAEVTIAGRTRTRARTLAAELGGNDVRLDAATLSPVLDGADLLVNATPVGGPGEEDNSPLPAGVPLHDRLTVFDVVYRPRVTPLLRAAIDAGAVAVEGVDMLVEQGARSFEMWTGTQAPVDVMRAAALEALDAD
jgi:shikimate dehydrogenase